MNRWPAPTVRRHHARWRFAGVFVAVLLGFAVVSGAPLQMPAPYGLFVHTDGELKSDYSDALKATVVQLALTPPGLAGTPSAASMVFRSQFPGRQPAAPPGEITILVLPAITSDPNVIRGVKLVFAIERAGARPLELSYFGKSWGEHGFTPPGGEITRVAFSMSLAELRSLLEAERVSGQVMNSSFEFTSAHLAALRMFATAIGVADQAGKPKAR